ncbi:hypothetical protein GQ457_01G051700 [Hibiscus cannabinus]
MEALKLIQEPTSSHSSISLVRAIATMVEKDWSVHFQSIPREANKVADLLAKLADPLQTTVTILDQPSNVLNTLLHRDVFGPPYCRPKH